MLSIIICSLKPELLTQLTENINKTIGIPFEIIAIDNSQNKYFLTQAYNLGAKKAVYNNLLFLHEDVVFRTDNWGQDLIDLIQNSEIGLIGVSGAVYKSQIPSTWSMIPSEYYRINAIQMWKNGQRTEHINKDNKEAIYSNVAVIDGVFMAMRKDVWTEFPFDEQNLKGFHLYDLDESLKIGTKYKIVVSHKLLVEHFSEGTIDSKWIREVLVYHKNNKNRMPISLKVLNKKEIQNIRYHAASSFCFILIRNNFTFLALKYIFVCFSIKLFSKTNKHLFSLFIKNLFK